MTGSTSPGIPGIHNSTAICSDPQRNLAAYGGVPDPRLVKKEELVTHLVLRPRLERRRRQIEARLPDARIPTLVAR